MPAVPHSENMATDAQGRLLSDDGIYYWDGTDWQLVDTTAGAESQQSGSGAGSQDAQGRLLSDDGNYYWDGSSWQLVDTQDQSASGSDADVPGDIAVSMQDEVAAPDGEIALSELEPLPQNAVS